MATALEKYYGMKENMNAAIAQGKLPVEHMLTFQEILLQIQLIEIVLLHSILEKQNIVRCGQMAQMVAL